MQRKSVPCKWELVITELFNIYVNDFDAKKCVRCNRVFVVTEIVVSGMHCYRPRSGEGNVLTGLCHSVHRGGGVGCGVEQVSARGLWCRRGGGGGVSVHGGVV